VDELTIVGVEVLTATGVVDITGGVGAGAGCLLRYTNIPEMRAANRAANIVPTAAIIAALTGVSAFLKAFN